MFLPAILAAVAVSAVPASTVPESTAPGSSAPAAAVAAATVPASNLDRYAAWATARETACEYPPGRAPFRPPVDPVLLQLGDPADLPELLAAADSARIGGGTVYFCYSPPRGEMEYFEFEAVLAAIRVLAASCDGFAPAFRRSGQHYQSISHNLAARFAVAAREGNTGIQLLGELYRGELNRGEVREGVGVFTFPGCAGLLGVNLPRGSRWEVYDFLKAAGVLRTPLVQVLRRGTDAGKRYKYHMFIDHDNDN